MKVPLYVKLMVSYLLVVGLVLLPSVVYLRSLLSRDQRARATVDMTQELSGICDRLGSAPASQLAARTDALLAALPTRLTVVDLAGNVLGDSARPSGAIENHGARPEIREALASGVGEAVRVSRTTGVLTLYVAMRFPREGAARGVARLSRPEASLHTEQEKVTDVLRNASALALTAAVLLSLVAAIATSRPLRRIAQAARSFADGDFAATIDADTGDEIGEVADALTALASQLRSRLVTSGVDRATLQALIDDLPVGVVLYDSKRQPTAVNGAARLLCDLAPFAEAERGAEIPKLTGQPAAIERCLRDGFTVEGPLALPWRPRATLVGRWVAVFAPDGERLPALVVLDRGDAGTIDALRAAVREITRHLRALRPAIDDAAMAAVIARDVLTAEELIPLPDLAAEAIEPTSVRALFAAAVDDLAPLAVDLGARFDLVASETEVMVADADRRSRRAVRALLRWALEDSRRPAAVELHVTLQERVVRLSVRASRAATSAAPDVRPLVRPIAGDAGVSVTDEGVDCWVALPRA